MDPNLLAVGMMPSFPAGVPPFVAFNPAFPQVPPPPPMQIPLPEVAINSPANPTDLPVAPVSQVNTQEWTQHEAPDGRTYYFNTVTRKSSWEKPDTFKTPHELRIARCPWKEHQSANGKPFYHNVETNESQWSIPKELEEIMKLAPPEEVPTSSVTRTDNTAAEPHTPSINSPAVSLEQGDEASRTSFLPDDDSQSNSDAQKIEYKDKKEMTEAFRSLLKDRNVPSNVSWETAVKLIAPDPRYQVLKKLPERKQIFNSYKTQRAKDEKEEHRMKIKKAKEELEQFLLNSPQLNMTIKYKKACELFGNLPVWTSVSERERKELYDDIMTIVIKRDKELHRNLRKKNMHTLADILFAMADVTHKTTWQEAQQLLLDNPTFADDAELLGMDKEDALTIFEDHIRQLEKDHEQERDREKRIMKRNQRKNREAFQAFLSELHEKGKLTSMSQWSELYATIRSDSRFNLMLGQPGSTPLDLFKFFVIELKDRLLDEKKIIKEILREKTFNVELDTEFETFVTVISEDKRSATLDAGNVKLTFSSLRDKAIAREKERVKEEQKKVKRAEASFRSLIRNLSQPVEFDTPYEKIKPLIEEHADFHALASESDRMRVFKEYTTALEESCTHHHTKKKSKKSKHKRNRSSSKSSASSAGSESESSQPKKKKKKKSKYSRSSSPEKSGRYLEASPSPSKRFSPVEEENPRVSEKYRHFREVTPEEGEVGRETNEALSERELEDRRRELLAQLRSEEANDNSE